MSFLILTLLVLVGVFSGLFVLFSVGYVILTVLLFILDKKEKKNV